MPISALIVQLGTKTKGSWAERNNFLHSIYMHKSIDQEPYVNWSSRALP